MTTQNTTTETTIYGVQNCAYHNLRAAGDVEWYSTEAERDAALATLRAQAIEGGLATSAARTTEQTHNVRRLASILRADELDAIDAAAQTAGEGWTGCDWTTDEHGLDLSGESAEDWQAAADACQAATRLGLVPEQLGGFDRARIFEAAFSGETDEDGRDVMLDHPDRMSLGEWAGFARGVWGDEGAGRLLQEVAELVAECARYLDEVEGAARQAQEYGAGALRALRDGDWDEAIAEIERACSCEDEYGDAPCWRPVADLVREYCGR